MTLQEMLVERVESDPNALALVHEGEHLTYSGLLERVSRTAFHLASRGFKKGDRTAMLVRKTPEMVTGFLGTCMAGGVAYTIDFTQGRDYVRRILAATRPAAMVVCDEAAQIIPGSDILPDSVSTVICKSGELPDRITWNDILATSSGNNAALPHVTGSDPAYLNFTSGSTGTPKAAITTHDNIYWNTRSSIEALAIRPDDVHLCMFSVFGHPHEFFARPLLAGGTMVLLDNISPRLIVRTINEYKVTCMMAVASIYTGMMRHYDSFSFSTPSLRLAESGGMHTPAELVAAFREKLGVALVPVWGSTETTGVALANPPDGGYIPGRTGLPCPHYEIRIAGENGETLPNGTPGEMLVRGPAVCSGYLDNQVETRRHMRDGWLHTGDIFRQSPDGSLFYESRSTGMIKVSGLKVFPREIEDVLYSHPAIAEVAVVRMPDNARGEVPCAFVVLKHNSPSATGTVELRDFCRTKLAPHKVPRHIAVIDELPKTPGGKIFYRRIETDPMMMAMLANDSYSRPEPAGHP